jgi:transposase
MLCDRREELSRLRVQTVNRLQRLLVELVPGQAKKDLTALQARAILASVRPRDIAGKTRRKIAADELADLVAVEKKMKRATAELKIQGPRITTDGPARSGTRSRRPNVGRRRRHRNVRRPQPLRVLDRHCAPDASSGEQNRHRLSRAGNRRMNHMIHIAAISQIRLDTPGRAYYRRKLAPARPRGDSSIQRGRPAPAHRHFGSATSRTRESDATTAPALAEDHRTEDPPDHRLTTQGSRSDALSCMQSLLASP